MPTPDDLARLDRWLMRLKIERPIAYNSLVLALALALALFSWFIGWLLGKHP